MGLKITAKYLRRLVSLQIVVMLALILVALATSGMFAAKSALAGALAFIIPNAVFVHNVFQYQGASAAKKIVRAFYKGEGVKLLLSILLFSIIFNFVKIAPLVFFGVYFCMQMLAWFTPFVIKDNVIENNT